MSVKEKWVKEGLEDGEELRVLTPKGKGEIVSLSSAKVFEVRMEKPKSAGRVYRFENGEITPYTDYTLVRIVNLGFAREQLLTVAQNYSSWEECLKGLDQPYSQDTTLIAFDFQDKKFATYRGIPHRPRYHLIEAYFDCHYLIKENIFFDSLQEAKEGWQKIKKLGGTTGHILFCSLIDMETGEILSRAIFTALRVITRETYWKKTPK